MSQRPRDDVISTTSRVDNQIDHPSGNLYLPGDIIIDPDPISVMGSSGILFRGFSAKDGQVALKRLKARGSDTDSEVDRRRRLTSTLSEARVWRALKHDHILPFLGVLHDYECDHIYLVSPFVQGGCLMDYIPKHPGVKRLALASDIADGLAYLHQHGIVHGDVKGGNVLIWSGPIAKLCDFGLSKLQNPGDPSTKGGAGTIRWQSPELMDGGPRTTEGDVYAYGMTVYEIISGNIPFHRYKEESQVVLAVILHDERPTRDEGSLHRNNETESLWEMAESCWRKFPSSRPSIQQLSVQIRRTLRFKTSFEPTWLHESRGSPRATREELWITQEITTLSQASPSNSIGQSRAGLVRLRATAPIGPVHDQTEPDKFLQQERLKRVEALPRAKLAGCHSRHPSHHLTCLEGTRVELLSEIRNWAVNLGPCSKPICLVSGMAGSGKSTIAQTLALEWGGKMILGASFFFCSAGDVDLRSGNCFISTLAYQLSKFDSEFKTHLMNALEQNPDAAYQQWSLQLDELILGPARHLVRIKPVVIVVDALDECVDEDAREILDVLFAIVDQFPIPIKLLITSRPEQYLTNALSHRNIHHHVTLQDIQEAVIADDIKLYLAANLQSSTFLPDSHIGELILHNLVQRSGQLFSCAATIIRFLQDNRIRSFDSQLSIIMDTRLCAEYGAMSSLDTLYRQILMAEVSSIGHQLSFEQIRNAIGAILAMRTPLQIEALEALIGLESGHLRGILYPLRSVVLIPEDDSKAASIHHLSFSDFITDPLRCSDVRFTIDIPTHQCHLARHCLRTLNFHLRQNIIEVAGPWLLCTNGEMPDLEGQVDRAIIPHLRYACCNWAWHVSQTRIGEESIIGALQQFLETNALWWLQVLSLLGDDTTGATALRLAQLWALASNCSDRLLSLLGDFCRFENTNGACARVSSQHIYYSALPFTPRDTALWKAYKNVATSSVKVISGQKNSWTPCRIILTKHQKTVNCVIFSSDGLILASGSDDQTVRVWDVISGDLLCTKHGHEDRVCAVALSRDSSTIASGSSDAAVGLWDRYIDGSKFWLRGHSGGVKALAFSPDDHKIVSGSSDATIRMWDVSKGSLLFVIRNHSAPIYAVAFSVDGSVIRSISRDTEIRVNNSCSGKETSKPRRVSRNQRTIGYSADGSHLASTGPDNVIRIWDTNPGSLVSEIGGCDDSVTALGFSSNGINLASASYNGKIRTWDASSGMLTSVYEGHINAVRAVSFSTDGSAIASASADGTVRLWTVQSQISSEKHSREHTGRVYAVVFSPDGSKLASASDGSEVVIRDSTSGALISRLEGRFESFTTMVFSADGSTIATGSVDGTMRLWHVLSGSPLRHEANKAIRNPSGIFAAIRKDEVERYHKAFSFHDGMNGSAPASQSIKAAASITPSFSEQRIGGKSLRQLFREGRWLFRREGRHVVSRVCYIPDEYVITSIASFPLVAPNLVALGCTHGQVLLLDLSALPYP